MSAHGRILRAALAYAERFGFAVFPCHWIRADRSCSCGKADCKSPGKHPLTEHGVKDGSKDPLVIRQWWNRWPEANVAIATGPASGIFVLDVDPRHGGDESLAALEAEHNKLPDTPIVLTGGGGLHIYFRSPKGADICNSAGAFEAGLDVRGDGGYVIAPPSLHTSGNPYCWEVSSRIDEVALADPPAWLLELLSRKQVEDAQVPRFEAPPIFEEGSRNDYLFRFARSQHVRHKLSFDEMIALLRAVNQARCKPPLDTGEVEQIARNAVKEPDRPDFKAPDPELARLAALPIFEYEKVRKAEAKRLNVRAGVLDGEVAKLRPKQQAEQAKAKEPPTWAPSEKLWPEAVAGAELLAELIGAIQCFVMLDETAALTAALWILFTWMFEHIAETNPYLRIISPTPECGKGTLLKIIARLARRGWILSRVTPSSFVRTMENERRTVLLDEGDAFLNENEIMRNVLDGASDPDTATVSMSVKSGDDWIPADFNSFVPIAIASIGPLRKMDTVESRSVAIHLKRASATELKGLTKARRRALNGVINPLAEKCARWATDNVEKLRDALYPELPEGLEGRTQDKWEPLIAIADMISAETGKAARRAAITISSARNGEDVTLGIILLGDIREMFTSTIDRLASKDICAGLAALEGSPWAEYGKAQKPISQNQLAKLLKPFQIRPHTIRLAEGSTPKGYECKDFEDAWARYLPDPKNTDTSAFGDPNRHTATTQRGEGEGSDFQTATDNHCGGSKNDSSAHGEKECGVVAGWKWGNKRAQRFF